MKNENVDKLIIKANDEFTKKKFIRSLDTCKKAIKRSPNSAQAYKLQSINLIELRRFDEAETALNRAISLLPDENVDLLHLLGCVYTEQKKYKQSLDLLEALFNQTGNSKILLDIGLNLQSLNLYEDAKSIYIKLLEFEPDNYTCKFNLSKLLLYFNEYVEGWSLYHTRLLNTAFYEKIKWYGPQWQGESLINKKILIWPEQGVGDNLLFSSCFNEAIEEASQSYLVCDNRFKSLYEYNFPNAEVITDIDLRNTPNRTFPIDVQILSGSLPYLYRSNLDAFENQKNLKVDPSVQFEQEKRLSNDKLKVGISWFHGKGGSNNEFSFDLQTLAPLFALENIEWVNLQFGADKKDLALLEKKLGIKLLSWQDSSAEGDFMSHCSLISCLDLVIAPCSASFMFASRLGIESWLLSPRNVHYIKPNNRSSLWLDNVRQFIKGTEEDWHSVIENVEQELKKVIN